MPRKCTFGCSPGYNLHLYPHPVRRPGQLQAWLDITGDLSVDKNEVYRSKRICDVHFLPKYHNRNNRLSAIAIPTLYLKGIHRGQTEQVNCDPETDIDSTSAQDHQGDNCVQELKAVESADVCSDKNIPKAPGRITIPPLEPRDIQAVPSASRQVDKGIPDTHDDDSDWFDDDDVLFHDEVISDTENGVVLPARSRDIQDEHFYNPKEHEGYSCNVCAGAIVGFRYVCVQCRDWDMCGTCEAAGSHAAHYVLRVPAPRAFAEMKSVLDAVRKALELSAHDPLYSGAPLRPDAALDADEIKSEKEWDGSNNVATNIEVPCEFIPEIEGNVSTVNDIDATENDNDMTDHLNDTTDHLNDTTDLRNDTTDHRNDTSSDHSDSFENRSENTENYDVITKNKHYASRKENNGENYYEDVTYLDDILEDEEMTAEDSKTINDLTEPSVVPYSKTSKHHFDQLLTGKNKPPKRPEKEMPKTYMVQFAAGDKRADNVERKKLCNTAKIQPKVVVKRLQIPKNVIRLRLKQIVSKTKKS